MRKKSNVLVIGCMLLWASLSAQASVNSQELYEAMSSKPVEGNDLGRTFKTKTAGGIQCVEIKQENIPDEYNCIVWLKLLDFEKIYNSLDAPERVEDQGVAVVKTKIIGDLSCTEVDLSFTDENDYDCSLRL